MATTVRQHDAQVAALLQQIERQQRFIAGVFDSVPGSLVVIDRLLRVVSANRNFLEKMRQEERVVRGRRLDEVLPAPLAGYMQLPEKLALVLRCGQTVDGGKVAYHASGLSQRVISYRLVPLKQGDVVEQILLLMDDITEHERLEASLVQSAKMASLGVMAGGIAHELRNPLGIISANAQLVLDRPDDAERRAMGLHKIGQAALRASQIISNLLAFARPSAEQAGKIDLHQVLHETMTMLADQLATQRVALRQQYCAGALLVRGHPDQLQQVFTNLVLNACNAMPGGGDLVVVTSRNDDGAAVVSLRDAGGGIAPRHLSQIFDPFFTTMPVGKGTGLGLSISYGIVQQHQGTITVESELGNGTTFTVSLPPAPLAKEHA